MRTFTWQGFIVGLLLAAAVIAVWSAWLAPLLKHH